MPKLTPYQFQESAIRKCMKALHKGRHPLLISPTGTGKTSMAVDVVSQFLRATPNANVWWIAHRVELLRQAQDALSRRHIGSAFAAKDGPFVGQVTLASPITMRNHRHHAGQIDLVVVDEAHRVSAKSYRDAIDGVDRAFGLTATPVRTNGEPLGELFNEPIVALSAQSAVDLGTLSDVDVWSVSIEDYRRLRKDLPRDLEASATQNELGLRMMSLGGRIEQEINLRAGSSATLVFASTIEQAEDLHIRLVHSGRKSCVVRAGTPPVTRAQIGDALTCGDLNTVVNVGVYQEGFDCSAIKCVALARPTSSVTVYLQQIGRAWRHASPVVIDFAGNAWLMGHPQDDRPWNARRCADGEPWFFDRERGEYWIGGTGNASAGDKARIKWCKGCGLSNPLSARTCRNCGTRLSNTYISERVEMELRNFRAEMAQVRKRAKDAGHPELARLAARAFREIK